MESTEEALRKKFLVIFLGANMESRERKCLKNFGFIQIVVALNMLCIIVSSILLLLTLPEDGMDQELIILISLLAGTLVALPWLVCFVFHKEAFSVIVFSADGIEQRCFGKQIKYIPWESVSCLQDGAFAYHRTHNYVFCSKDHKISVILAINPQFCCT